MASISILTDSSVYFPNPAYPGHEFVSIIPLNVKIGRDTVLDSKDPKDHMYWMASDDPSKYALVSPSVEEFCHIFQDLGRKYVDIITVLHSSALSPVYQNASKAASIVKNSGTIIVIDSHTLGAGLGFLIQAAAEAADDNKNIAEVSQVVRRLIPHVYTAMFLPNLRYLSHTGLLDPAQAIVGEMLEIIPFYILDTGSLVSVQKAKTSRQLIDQIFEFVNEFFKLSHIFLLQGFPLYEQEMRALKERIASSMPNTPLSEHNLNMALMTQIGPHVLGVVAMEDPNDNL